MFRQSSSRNQRTKGFRTKHGLQVFLLMAVCVWLLYQVKHSHDKRQALDESGAGSSEKVEDARHDVFNLGRKDISERIQMTTDRQKEDGDEEEEDEGKREVREEEEEEEGKHEENEEEERGVGDDELDERDQEKIDEDAEQEEELVDGEDEKENDGEKDNQFDDMDASETQKHNNDDAGSHDGESSSSHGLIHDTQILRSDIAKLEQEQESAIREQGEGSNERDPDKDIDTIDATLLQTKTKEAAMEELERSRNSSDLPRVLRERETVGDFSHNLTVSDVKLSEVEDESHLNSTVGELKEQIESDNYSTAETAETPVSMIGDKNITFSGTEDHEFQGHNTTLYKVQNQNRTLTEEQQENIDADSEDGESDEQLESLELDESEDENSLATQEERDALTDLETLPQHEDEEANNEAVSEE
ncbi:uncharacterized protein LOC116252140 [Nymphaea colorata]|uniref:uncharacterized protein LOC116252140 n=1 Tax=Nymphaea colorata TaxID=210225 RepID=UPI00129E4C87|nr:uncharacterized protein LOC116252140 [Nymphaea colorata]XP_031482084.1 uncharacterized protein LOC116252140 [Nymphaea colorata]XP_031482085.1 uncharacterized protein LOC116252140 [Nymphaea colorata]